MSDLPHASPRIQIEELGAGVIVARFVGNELGLFGREDAPELFDLVERADRDPDIRAVVFTGSHPHRFISHADLRWLQEDGSVIPPVGRGLTSLVARIAHQFCRSKLTRWVASKTSLMGAISSRMKDRTAMVSSAARSEGENSMTSG
jgi:enoyl-CoA hydratase/carnithine racemase